MPNVSYSSTRLDIREEVENVLLRNKIFEFLASNAKITYKEAEAPVSN